MSVTLVSDRGRFVPARRDVTTGVSGAASLLASRLYDHQVSELHAPLLRWYDEHARDLPWRRTTAICLGRPRVGVDAPADAGGPGPARLRRVDGAVADPRLAGSLTGGGRDPRVGPARLPEAGHPAPRRGHGDHRAARRHRSRHLRHASRAARRRRLHGLGRAGLRVRSPAAGARHQRAPGAGARGDRGRVPTQRRDRRGEVRRAQPAAGGRADGGHLVGRADGARRPGLHRGRTRLRQLPRARRAARGGSPATRRTTVRRVAARPGRGPTGSAVAG